MKYTRLILTLLACIGLAILTWYVATWDKANFSTPSNEAHSIFPQYNGLVPFGYEENMKWLEFDKTIERNNVTNPSANVTWIYSENFSYLINWELGNDIVPYPEYTPKLDCDDGDIYSYLWLKYQRPELKVKIMYGLDPNPTQIYINGQPPPPKKYHVWLVADNGTAKYAYDLGMAIDYPAYFQGREISYAQLLSYARRDQ